MDCRSPPWTPRVPALPGEGDLNNVVPAVQIWPRLAFDWLRRTFDVR